MMRRRGGFGRKAVWVVIGLALGLVIGWIYAGPERSQALSEESLVAARARWESAGPSTYEAVIEVRGSTGTTHRIRVVEGEVVEMTSGGRPASKSAWPYWTVDGLFRFLETELANAADPESAFGAPAGNVVLRARFDETLGYPEYFMRHVLGGGSSVEWIVEELTPTG